MKKLSINTPILPVGLTHVDTTWNIYDAHDILVQTESGNIKNLISYDLGLPLDETSYYTVEAILKLSDGSLVTTSRVKILKNTRLITDTTALPPIINFEIRKDGFYRLSIGPPKLIGGVDEWVSTDWEVTSTAGVTLFTSHGNIANKDMIEIPDSVLTSYDFVVFKARYNLRQNTESKFGSFNYVRKHSDTEFILDQQLLLENQTNNYRLLHSKPINYLFNYIVTINGYNVLDGIIGPESHIIIPSEFTLGVDTAEIRISDVNFSGTYDKTFKLKLVKNTNVIPYMNDVSSGKKDLTFNSINVSDILTGASGQITISPIYQNALSLQVQGGDRTYDNTFRCTYFDLGTQTLGIMKVGSTIERLSIKLDIIPDIVSDFSTYYLKHNRVAFFYRTTTNQGKLRIYDMSDTSALLIDMKDISPITNITSFNGDLYWITASGLSVYDGNTQTISNTVIQNTNDKFIGIFNNTKYIFSSDGTVYTLLNSTTMKNFSDIPVNNLNVITLADTIILSFEVNGVKTIGVYEDYFSVLTTIENLNGNLLLLTDHYNKHLTIVKG